jgi:hypothetical protein
MSRFSRSVNRRSPAPNRTLLGTIVDLRVPPSPPAGASLLTDADLRSYAHLHLTIWRQRRSPRASKSSVGASLLTDADLRSYAHFHRRPPSPDNLAFSWWRTTSPSVRSSSRCARSFDECPPNRHALGSLLCPIVHAYSCKVNVSDLDCTKGV